MKITIIFAMLVIALGLVLSACSSNINNANGQANLPAPVDQAGNIAPLDQNIAPDTNVTQDIDTSATDNIGNDLTAIQNY